jgi:hypothetical protein
MNSNQKYSSLWTFFIVYFSDPVDYIDELKIVNDLKKDVSLEFIADIQKQISFLKEEDPFPWQEIGEKANRYFECESDTREWLDEISLAL